MASSSLIYVVGSRLKDDSDLLCALKQFDAKLLFLDDNHNFDNDENLKANSDDDTVNDCFIVSNFEDDLFHSIRKKTSKIFGPLAVIQFLSQKQSLPIIQRPLFCNAMNKIVICFAGFRKKEQLADLVTIVHHMGGSIRKDFSPSVTHLIANSTSGEKYRYAVCLGKPIMSPKWIEKCWEKLDTSDFVATDLDLAEYRVRPFMSCILTFVGFLDEEKQHMEELTVLNGGTIDSESDPTHTIVDDRCLDVVTMNDGFVVKVEWFWASIQMDARADELIYRAKTASETGVNNGTPGSGMTPNSRTRKRKRLKDTLGQLASLTDVETSSPTLSGTKQRRSGELGGVSMSPSMLDATTSPITASEDRSDDKLFSDGANGTTSPNGSMFKPPPDVKVMSARQQVCHELLQTETNYVGILDTIITLIRDPIEDPNQVGGPLLDPTEVKIIFGNVSPIHEVHRQLRDDLLKLVNAWKEENSIGSVVVKYSQDFLKAYPPFVNFFEKTKEMLLKCDAAKPRFHAFLKICQMKPECGRQSLVELLIRPVQRLPSVILLLGDILKHTAKNNPDHEALEEAAKCLKEVLTHINEDKRKTEGQVAMFGIVNDIENCPANLLSSHRHFVTKADMIELSDVISGKGDSLTMFLFTDVLEICKRRRCCSAMVQSSTASMIAPLVSRSPSVISLHSARSSQQKSYKHLELMPLSHVRRIVDINETDDCRNVFALICRSTQELKERLYTFTLVVREIDQQVASDPANNGGNNNGTKIAFLRTLCRHVANTVCRADYESFFTSLEPHRLDIMSSDITTNTLSKAVRFASKTSKKVGRAFSFSKTPRRLSRAVSTMISPLIGPGSPSPSPLKNASKKFPCASTTNLHLIDSPSRSVPSSPGFGHKLKSFTIGPSSLGKRM